MKIILNNDVEIENINIYLNGKYQEDLVIQIRNADYLEMLALFKDVNNTKAIKAFEDDGLKHSHYFGFTTIKRIQDTDDIVTIVLTQALQLDAHLNHFKENISEIEGSIDTLNSQINPVFDWETATLEECREYKRAEIAKICTHAIYEGFDAVTSKGNQHFGLTLEDQANINGLVPQISTGASSVLYHADGELCRTFTVEEFISVMTAATFHKTYNTTLCNHINKWIDSCEIKEDISKITFDFSDMPVELQEHMAALLSPDQDSNIVEPELPPETVFPIE